MQKAAEQLTSTEESVQLVGYRYGYEAPPDLAKSSSSTTARSARPSTECFKCVSIRPLLRSGLADVLVGLAAIVLPRQQRCGAADGDVGGPRWLI